MEENCGGSAGCRKRRKRTNESSLTAPPPPPLDLSSFDRTVFPLLLASAANLRNPQNRSIVKRFLRAHLALLTTGRTAPSSLPPLPLLLPQSFVALLPLLLTSRHNLSLSLSLTDTHTRTLHEDDNDKDPLLLWLVRCSSVAALSAEVVGAAALWSLEANTMIASDDGAIKCLVWALGSRSRRVVDAVCNSIMDLSASPIGRERLRDSFAIERLLWEGFAHVALHDWNEKQKQASCQHFDSKLETLRTMFSLLLHVSIRLISDHDPIFRKACMVAAKHWFADNDEDHHVQTLMLSQRATFGYIIDRIHASSNYIEAFRIVETVIQEGNDDSLQWMRWLQHLPQHGDVDEKLDFNNLLGVLDDLIVLYNEDDKKAMTEFTLFKSKFCRYVIFEDACKSFGILLEKYRKTRKQYMKGMLSLHSKNGY